MTARLCGTLSSCIFPAALRGRLTSSTSCSTSPTLSCIDGHCTHISKRRNTCSWHLEREKYQVIAILKVTKLEAPSSVRSTYIQNNKMEKSGFL